MLHALYQRDRFLLLSIKAGARDRRIDQQSGKSIVEARRFSDDRKNASRDVLTGSNSSK